MQVFEISTSTVLGYVYAEDLESAWIDAQTFCYYHIDGNFCYYQNGGNFSVLSYTTNSNQNTIVSLKPTKMVKCTIFPVPWADGTAFFGFLDGDFSINERIFEKIDFENNELSKFFQQGNSMACWIGYVSPDCVYLPNGKRAFPDI
jgi:hypothetical protein